jgi:probable rRNA maturation factor
MQLPELHLQNEDDEPCPESPEMQRWVAAALAEAGFEKAAELTVRIVGEAEMRELNEHYRGIPRATNVLSFAAQLPAQLQLPLLGDVIICAPLLEREALQQNKVSSAHWAHLVVHGTLHLLGFDHIDDAEAQAMELLETRALDKLDFAAPYEHQAPPRERPASS